METVATFEFVLSVGYGEVSIASGATGAGTVVRNVSTSGLLNTWKRAATCINSGLKCHAPCGSLMWVAVMCGLWILDASDASEMYGHLECSVLLLALFEFGMWGGERSKGCNCGCVAEHSGMSRHGRQHTACVDWNVSSLRCRHTSDVQHTSHRATCQDLLHSTCCTHSGHTCLRATSY